LAAGGLIVVDVWNEKKICVLDKLGSEFLETVQEGDRIKIQKEGSIIIGNPQLKTRQSKLIHTLRGFLEFSNHVAQKLLLIRLLC